MARHARILRYSVGSVRRRWRKNLVVVAVYAVVIAALASVVFLTRSLTQTAVAALAGTPEMLVQRLSVGRHGLVPVTEAERLAKVRGVAAAWPRLWAYCPDAETGELMLVRVPDAQVPQDGEAAVGRALLQRRALGVGGRLPLLRYDGDRVALRVAAALDPATPLESGALIDVSEPTFRALTGMPAGWATDIGLRVRNRRELPTIAEKIARADAAARPIIRDELARTYAAVFNWRSGVLVAALLVPVLAFILFAWDKAAGLSPDERREIGLLKAVGWETGDVILLKLYESLAISVAAFALGATLAFAGLALPRAFLVLPALLGWSTLYPPFRPAAAVGAYQIATLFFLAVFPYLVATVIPAWRAATTDPDDVMRT